MDDETARGTREIGESRILMLTIPGPYTRWIVREVSRHISLSGLILQERSAKTGKSAHPSRLKLGGIRRRFQGQHRRRKEEALRIFREMKAAALERFYRRTGGPVEDWPRTIPTFVSTDPSAGDSLSWCREIAPDFVLVLGASILRPDFLRIPSTITINAHPSLLPDFRGQFVEFWQVFFDRTDRSGITIHRVDEGIDTGDILLQRPLEPEKGVDPFEIQARCALLIPEAFQETLRLLGEGKVQLRPQEGRKERAYRARDLRTEDIIELLQRLGRLPVE